MPILAHARVFNHWAARLSTDERSRNPHGRKIRTTAVGGLMGGIASISSAPVAPKCRDDDLELLLRDISQVALRQIRPGALKFGVPRTDPTTAGVFSRLDDMRPQGAGAGAGVAGIDDEAGAVGEAQVIDAV